MLAQPASLSFKETILLSGTLRGEEELPYSCLWKFVSSSASLPWVSSPHPLCGTYTSLGGSHAGKQMALRLTLCPLLVEVVAGGEGRRPDVVAGGSSGPMALASPAAPRQCPKQKGELDEILLHGFPTCISPPAPPARPGAPQEVLHQVIHPTSRASCQSLLRLGTLGPGWDSESILSRC